jgi:hypothetical protein
MRSLQEALPRARSGGCDRIRHGRACIRPASLRPNVQKARAPGRVRERSLRRDLHSAQCASNRAADGRDLDGVRQPGAQMIACPIQKDLCLVLYPTKGG